MPVMNPPTAATGTESQQRRLFRAYREHKKVCRKCVAWDDCQEALRLLGEFYKALPQGPARAGRGVRR